jgi:predicted lipoprotein with Yx(FWY)xxD motif
VSRPVTLALAPLVGAVLIAGCGGSSKSATTAASSQAATTSAQSSYAPAATTAATGGGGAATVITAKASKLGTILAAGPKRLTVYLFEGDKGSSSSCSGECAAVWPAVTTSGTPHASGAALIAKLGTIKRSDGTTQVTYNGHPLYYYAKDGDAGDAYGQGIVGFGAGWYVLAPSGSKIDTS